ncbi:MAG TPA: phosphoribosylanthranilate isomerase [Firmicutes bacterium]|nr:phosphoribosylanthranilate isomerase [Bacillota bacterium]
MKICGLTVADEAVAAAEAGADAIGFVLAPSPRRVAPARAREIAARLPQGVLRVGVFVSPPPEEVEQAMAWIGLDLAQIHGVFPPEGWRRLGGSAIRGVRVGRDRPEASLIEGGPRFLLLDTYRPEQEGGTGQSFDWLEARAYRELGRPLLVAGGLTPANVQAALAAAGPDGVDVSSGVETSPGRKDPALVAAFVAAVREWERDRERRRGT